MSLLVHSNFGQNPEKKSDTVQGFFSTVPMKSVHHTKILESTARYRSSSMYVYCQAHDFLELMNLKFGEDLSSLQNPSLNFLCLIGSEPNAE